MPVEIKELHIKATVANSKSQNGFDKEAFRREKEKLKKEIIKECLEELSQLLQEKNER